MIEVFSGKSLTQEEKYLFDSLADYCNEVLHDICNNENFYFLKEVNLCVSLIDEEEGTAIRTKIQDQEIISINRRFIRYVQRIFRRVLITEFAKTEYRSNEIANSLQQIAFLHVRHWNSRIPSVSHKSYFFQPNDQQVIFSHLTTSSGELDVINKYLAEHPEKFEDWWKLFVVFLILHEVGHVLWDRGFKEQKLWDISQNILRKEHKEHLDNPFKSPLTDWSIDDVMHIFGDEIFCDSIAVAGCFMCINQNLSVEEMRCAMRMYGDVFLFLTAVDNKILNDLFPSKSNDRFKLSRKRINLFKKVLNYLISEADLWPRYSWTSNNARIHIYSIDNYFLRFWIDDPLVNFFFNWVENQRISWANQIRDIAAKLKIPHILLESFIASDEFLSRQPNLERDMSAPFPSSQPLTQQVIVRELTERYKEWVALKQLLWYGSALNCSDAFFPHHEETKFLISDLKARVEALELVDRGMFSAAKASWIKAQKLNITVFNSKKADSVQKYTQYYYTRVASKIQQMFGNYKIAAKYAQEAYKLIEHDSESLKAQILYDIAHTYLREGVRIDDDALIQKSIKIGQQAQQSAETVGDFFQIYTTKYLIASAYNAIAIKCKSEDYCKDAISLFEEIENVCAESKLSNLWSAENIRSIISTLRRKMRIDDFSSEDEFVARHPHLIHKIKAQDTTGRWVCYFVLVDSDTEHAFLEALDSKDYVNLDSYGKVIASSYGEEPSEEVKTFLKEKYGFIINTETNY